MLKFWQKLVFSHLKQICDKKNKYKIQIIIIFTFLYLLPLKMCFGHFESKNVKICLCINTFLIVCIFNNN